VGPASAGVAADLGFADVTAAGGDLESLAANVASRLDPAGGPLVHAAGSVLSGDLAALLEAKGFAVRRLVLYDARPAARLAPETEAALRAGMLDAALFFSPRTARTFVSLVGASGLDRSCLEFQALCLSNAVAAALDPLPLRRRAVAAHTTTAALLRLAGIEGPE
jgi:uroporphyrinogen-III synthase